MGQSLKKRLLFQTIPEDRLSNSILSHSLVICLYIALYNIFTNAFYRFPLWVNYKWFACIFLSMIGLIIIEKKKYRLLNIYKIFMVLFVFVIITYTWFSRGGNTSLTLSYFFLILLIITMVFENSLLIYFFSGLSVILFSSLIYIEYKYPHYINVTISPIYLQENIFQMIVLIIALLKLMHVYISSYKAQNKKLEEYAYMDPLLDIHSRRHIMSNLQSISSESKGENKMYIMMLDIDNLKKINDSFGHVMGDSILVEISNRLKSIIGECGHIGRYGGDEFLIIFNNLDFNKINEIIDKIRELEIYFMNNKCTISGGVVCLREEENAINAICRADALLLRAKHSGKNTIFKDLNTI
ncbi:MAG: diguanylate cyclase [Peptostreptococcales bacterium]|jgi:diguanylate cyclase (GGDEF)-like protein